jgi:uncharacterized protein YuzE
MTPIEPGDAITIPAQPTALNWDYDEEADVLYLSVGDPRPAVGIDIGEGLVIRFDEAEQSVVGLTVIGLRARTLQALSGT